MSLSSKEIKPQRFGRKEHKSQRIDSSSPNWQRRGDSSPRRRQGAGRKRRESARGQQIIQTKNSPGAGISNAKE